MSDSKPQIRETLVLPAKGGVVFTDQNLFKKIGIDAQITPYGAYFKFPIGWVAEAKGANVSIKDGQDRQRMLIEYASPGELAHILLVPRYSYRCTQWQEPSREDGTMLVWAIVDNAGPSWSILYEVGRASSANEQANNELKASCEMWLDQHYSDWRDAAAYWN